MKNKINIIISGFVVVILAACNYLDVPYDNRAKVDSEDKVGRLLVSAYSGSSEWTIAELSSDNADKLVEDNFSTYYQLEEQSYLWKPATEIVQDSPNDVWEGYYKAIANANLALDAIHQIRSKGGLSIEDLTKLQAYEAEAYMCRAYNHFVLANIFCMPYGSNTANELGIPYMEKVENTVAPQYKRGTLAETYNKIDLDIKKALEIGIADIYDIPKYRFNSKAAYAFAARFYLYYQKYDLVLKYANEVLGNNVTAALRNWVEVAPDPNKKPPFMGMAVSDCPNWFIGANNHANLLNKITISNFPLVLGPYGIGTKYCLCDINASTESVQLRDPWCNYTSQYYHAYGYMNIPKVITYKYAGYFEYVDPVAQIGYYHGIQMLFSTDETLLCRIEAEIMLGKYGDAVDDMNTFMLNFADSRPRGLLQPIVTPKSLNEIVMHYDTMKYYTPFIPTPKKHIHLDNPNVTIQEHSVQENLLHCCLYLRRLLTVHEGLRWYDVKRMGIEIYRRDIKGRGSKVVAVTDSLKVGDPRRAIQIPEGVIKAGIQPNPR